MIRRKKRELLRSYNSYKIIGETLGALGKRLAYLKVAYTQARSKSRRTREWVEWFLREYGLRVMKKEDKWECEIVDWGKAKKTCCLLR